MCWQVIANKDIVARIFVLVKYKLFFAVFKPGDRRKAPMSFEEFQIYLDKEGRLIDYKGFRESIYLGGVVPSMRIIVWRHLLCVFPSGRGVIGWY